MTPLQVLNYINLISTKGLSPNCHFVFVDNLPKNSRPKLNEKIWQEVHEGMRSAVSGIGGTGKKSDPMIDGLIIYGKTGTAENPHGDNHAWFAGWADYQNKIYSLVILLENAGSGGAIAAPLAKEILIELFSDEMLTVK